jgi:hypothetical protein
VLGEDFCIECVGNLYLDLTPGEDGYRKKY